MYFLYHIWSSGCLLSLPVVMCVLGPVLSCYCYAVPGMTDSILSFLSCAIAKRGLYSHVCCSVINFPNRWYSCIYVPLLSFLSPFPLFCSFVCYFVFFTFLFYNAGWKEKNTRMSYKLCYEIWFFIKCQRIVTDKNSLLIHDNQ